MQHLRAGGWMMIWSYLWKVLVTLVSFAALKFLYNGVTIRMKYRKLKRQGIPMLPHSFLFGHIPIILDSRKELPKDANFIAFPRWLKDNFKRYFPNEDKMPPVIYFDMWPFFSSPTVVVCEHTKGTNIQREPHLSKHPILEQFLEPLTDNLDILSTSGPYWKIWRQRLNPAFNPRAITAMTPELIEEVQIFADQLTKLAGEKNQWGPVFQLEELTTNLTLDILAKSIVGKSLGEQTVGSSFKPAILAQAQNMESRGDVSRGFNPFGPSLSQRRDVAEKNEIMYNTLVTKDLAAYYDVEKHSMEKPQMILSRLLKSIFEEIGQKPSALDPSTYKSVVSQVKILMFAGFDSSASAVCWIFKMLQDHPDCLARMRAEHDEVLGKDIGSAAGVISNSPYLVNSLVYTTAIIKETLRLNPVSFAIRNGTPDYFLTVPDSDIKYPTDGFGIWDGIAPIHRDPTMWERADEFLPERFLAQAGEPLYPPKEAFRPFGAGHRGCIGQDLAMTEFKLICVLLGRKFDIGEAWDKWDAKKGNTEKPTVYGQRMYPAGAGTMHPKDGMPCHVRLRTT